MTINVAFKLPDAAVFVTDGLGTLSSVDSETGGDHVVSSVADVEKLCLLRNGRLLVMFNGVGNLGADSMAAELRRFDASRTASEDPAAFCRALARYVEERARLRLGEVPRPLHLIVAGFDPSEAEAPPQLYALHWKEGAPSPSEPEPILQREQPGGIEHQFGAFYAGATVGPARFAEGFDPELLRGAVQALVGVDEPEVPPGILVELIHAARSAGPGARPLPNAEARKLAMEYAGRIVRSLFPREQPELSVHYSLQAAINYSLFLAACAYARENWSPARHGPARVGSTLQVAYLERYRPAQRLTGITLDVALRGFLPERGLRAGP